jgi:hypothetical protein
MSPSTKRKWQKSYGSTNSDPSARLKAQTLSHMVETLHNGQGWLQKPLPSGVLTGSMAGVPPPRRSRIRKRRQVGGRRRSSRTGNSSLSVAEV